MRNFLLLTIIFLTLSKTFSQFREPHAGGEFKIQSDCVCVTEEQRQRIFAKNKQAIAQLTAEGKIVISKSNAVSFIWPLRQASNSNDYSYYGISNYIDHNPAYNGQLLDYNGGIRTYDVQGYNHKGTDIFTWPFYWYKMNNNQVEIVAAEDGVIINKDDGNFDHNCSFNNGNWNAVYLSHSDGSVTWYGHMKLNSLTTKNVGDAVTAGEYLGVVGSSGSSTGPHLHFEVYSNISQTNLIDPWFGSSNSTITSSWWQNQKPYFEPKINKVATHSDEPVFPQCPQEEILNLKNNFVSGDTIFFYTYYQDQLRNMVSSYKVYTPDNLVWSQWSASLTSDSFWVASYWGWWNILPSNAAQGDWRFSAVFNGLEYSHTFQVNVPNAVEDDDKTPTGYFVSDNYPNPFNPSTKLNYSIPKYGLVTIKLFDILGNEIKILENGYKSSGNYELTIDGNGLQSGVYFVSLRTGNFMETKKIVLAK